MPIYTRSYAQSTSLASMDLIRVQAYETAPQRLVDSKTTPRGGAVTVDADITKVLVEYFEKSKLSTQPTVDLRRPNSKSPSAKHDLRESVISFCFGAAATAKSAAVAIARKLAGAMDNRSDFTLLLLAAYKLRDEQRRLVMWAFPKDEPFHFSARKNGARIKILKDAFSSRSAIKKGALFDGIDGPDDFWSCHVIDKSAENGFGNAADYWISLFLDSRPSLTGKAGTRILARTLRKTHDSLTRQSDKDEVSNAIVAVRASQRRRWSLTRFANDFLAGDAKTSFLQNAPSELKTASFAFDKNEFDRKVNFRVFRLDNNVIVSAPFSAIGKGKGVTITDGQKRHLKCEGDVATEKVRAQYAG